MIEQPMMGGVAMRQNKKGLWTPAIPEPYFGIKMHCVCGKKFWRRENYNQHYAYQHIYKGER